MSPFIVFAELLLIVLTGIATGSAWMAAKSEPLNRNHEEG